MRQIPADGDESESFKLADEKIDNLLKRLKDKNLCPCCVARALALHAASLAIPSIGSAPAIEMFESIILAMHRHDVPAPEPLPSPQAH